MNPPPPLTLLKTHGVTIKRTGKLENKQRDDQCAVSTFSPWDLAHRPSTLLVEARELERGKKRKTM